MKLGITASVKGSLQVPNFEEIFHRVQARSGPAIKQHIDKAVESYDRATGKKGLVRVDQSDDGSVTVSPNLDKSFRKNEYGDRKTPGTGAYAALRGEIKNRRAAIQADLRRILIEELRKR